MKNIFIGIIVIPIMLVAVSAILFLDWLNTRLYK